jgi:hypothetical protein
MTKSDRELIERLQVDARNIQTDCGMNGDTDPRWQVGERIFAAASAIARLSAGRGWRTDFENAPKDEIIWVWCPARDGLSAMTSLCQWHEDAGFCVDEIREPTLWQLLQEPASPSEQGEEKVDGVLSDREEGRT